MPFIKLTKSTVDKLPAPQKGQVFYRDTTLTGFGIYAGMTSKTYYVEKWINNKAVRVTIGKHGQVTTEQARKKAQELLGKMSAGINPNQEKKAQRVEGITLKNVFEDFLNTRKSLKERTIYDYKRAVEGAFRDWQKKPLNEISKDMVFRKHSKLGNEIGHAQANQAMRFLRALFNFAMGKYENGNGQPLITVNPVRSLSETKAWYRIERRKTMIKPHELPAWYQAVIGLKNYRSNNKAETLRDYLLLCLFTGLRRTEAAQLKWEHVDFKAKTLSIPDTKNWEPLTLPLSDFLYDLLLKRKKGDSEEFVFPGEGATGHIVEPRKQMRKVIAGSGVQFTVHDLRRTFVTIAESLDIPAYALKMLLNHKAGSDVTAGYIISDVERLRRPMQRITDHLLKLAGVKPLGKIIEMKSVVENV